ncbi:MAG: RNA polymerase sigma factor [Chitinophagales bacterium]
MENFNSWLSEFKKGKTAAVNVLYEEYRPFFVRLMQQKHRCSEEEAIDIFQDSIIVLYKNAQAGKLDDLRSQLKTYFFRVGVNIFLKRLEKQKRSNAAQETSLQKKEGENIGIEQQLQLKDRKKLVAQLLKRMENPCQTILYLFYYRRYSIEAIQKKMDYNSSAVVRTQKKRCVRTFERQLKKVIKRGDL